MKFGYGFGFGLDIWWVSMEVCLGIYESMYVKVCMIREGEDLPWGVFCVFVCFRER